MAEALHLAREVFGEHRQTPAVLADAHAFPTDATRHIALQWDFIQSVNARLVRAQAARQNAMVYTFAANDVTIPGTNPLPPDERRILRHHPNPNNTGGRPGVLSVCTGMRVELTEKLGAILKATAGTVEHVLLHPNEDMEWCAEGSAQRRDGEVVLRHLPSLLVHLDGYADGPIPGHPDLALLEPTSGHRFTWRWQTQRTLRSKVERYQLPLLPTWGLTPYTAQGMTADWALLHVERSANEPMKEWWYTRLIVVAVAQ